VKPQPLIVFSFLGMVLLAVIQFYFVREVYLLKSREFDLQRQFTIDQALEELDNRYGQTGFDSVFYAMEPVAYEWYIMCDTASISGLPEVYNQILSEAGFLIRTRENFTPVLSIFLARQNQETDFHLGYIIREFSLLGEGNQPGFELPVAGDKPGTAFGNTSPGLYVNTFRAEGNRFRIAFDFFVDFTYKRKIIYRSMMAYFLLGVFSILAVGLIFIITIRHWHKQKKLSDLKTEFINRITHDLKTPLATIAVASESLLDKQVMTDPARVRSLSEVIFRQNRYLSGRINQVLDISFQEHAGIRLNNREIIADEFLADLVTDFRKQYEGKDVVVEKENLVRERKLVADPVMLATVINNLLDNAVKYGGEKPVVRVRSWWNEGWYISVSDNGPGMDADERRQVFGKFYRGSAGRASGSEGLGLGLYQAKQLVEAHGGSITVRSRPGKGSTFIIYIPQIPPTHENSAGGR